MPARRTGSGFTNLQTYLGLNQGIAGRMGNAIVAPVEEQGAKVQGEIDTALDTFEGQVDEGTLKFPNLAPGQPLPPGTTYQQVQELSQRGYTGPNSLDEVTDVAALYGRAADVGNRAGALGTNTGRATLLNKEYGQTTWGGGQLDAALAGAGSAGGRIAAANRGYKGLVEKLGGAQRTAEEAVKTA